GLNTLRKPARGGKRHNLANIIKKRADGCSQGNSSNADTSGEYTRQSKSRADPASPLSAAVTAKIEDGNIRAALRILSSEDKPAPDTDDIFKAHRHTPSPCF